ncbi:MAG: MTAP family purine nucleoside phosphorylase [Candidatus Bathyarchaeia archaeon]
MGFEIPRVKVAVIGGSAISGSGFPEEFEDVEVISKGIEYLTPFGPTAPFTHARSGGIEFLFVPFHGITPRIRNTIPDSASERVFYVLMRAGVKKILGCALCGSTNRLLDPGDVVIPDGFVDYTTRRAQSLTRSLIEKGIRVEPVMYRLHQPFCPELSRLLIEASQEVGFPRVFRRGVVGVSEGPRLESASEIQIRYAVRGIDVVTMNLVPEVLFAREIGACYATLQLVSNYGEGLVSSEWEGPEAFKEFQERWRRPVSEAILKALKRVDPDYEGCGCGRHRWRAVFG